MDTHIAIAADLFPRSHWLPLLDAMFNQGLVSAVQLPAAHRDADGRFPVVHRIHSPDLDALFAGGDAA